MALRLGSLSRASATVRRRLTTTALNQASTATSAGGNTLPLFRFGVCADIQYVNSDDDFNFQKTKLRRYRQSLTIFKEAVQSWNSNENKGRIDFALILGDILDGKTATLQNQVACLEEVLAVTRGNSDTPFAFYPTCGNHDFYAFTRSEIFERLYKSSIPDTSPTKLYYDFTPHPGWRVVSLDAYDVSLIGASSEMNRQKAVTTLAEHNPNDLNISGSWFNNLPRDKYRYVPYNGGIGDGQLAWFAGVLEDARIKQQRCIVFCHQPCYATDKPQSMLWNAETVRDVMKKSGNVALWMAGHDHDGQFNRCEDGIYHLVPPAPIECGVGERAYGVIEVFESSLKLVWTGREPSRETMRPWAKTKEMLL